MSGKRRRGSPTFSAICQEQSRMPLRKRTNKDNTGVSGESRQEVGETQEDNSSDDKDEVSNPAAVRQTRRKDRENKLKSKEMTEEEMMDLALRLSEHEANVTARRLQEEEEAVRRAIQDSMLGESQSQSLICDAPLCVSSRRKLVYSNGESQSDSERLTIDTSSSRERSRAVVKMSGVDLKRTKKRKRGEGSPLMEMPDLSQSQPSPSSSETAPLGSPQSCDSTQIEHCDLRKSPVFPSSSSAALQASVLIPRLDQDVLDSCTTSGFVLCSQDSRLLSPQKQTRSPTFPKSPAPRSNSYPATQSRTEILDSGDDTQPNLRKSPVFGQTDSSRALKPEAGESAALVFSSQGSSTSFGLEGDVSLLRSPVFAMTERGRGGAERSRCESPVFGTNGRTVKTSGEDEPEDDAEEEEEEEEHDTTNLSEQELTADMTLHWSDEEDDDATPVVSPSPVFPEERPVPQTNNEIQNQESASASAQCRVNPPESQSRAVSDVPCSSAHSAAQSTVHYYWGVPFCPRGLDPDAYTKVIVAQMEVYEKSLKQAQRALLKKLEWGEPILPQPEKSPSPESDSPRIHLTTRRSRRRRGKVKEPESDEERVEVDEETQREQREGEEDEEGREEAEGPEQEQRDQAQVDSDWEVCPETQLSDNDSTQDLTLPTQPPDKSPEIETVQVDSPAVDEPQRPEPEEQMEVDPESQEEPAQDPAEPAQSKPVDVDLGGPTCESQPRQEPGLRRSESPELDPVLVPGRQSSVQCPICLRAFPSEEIEMHAAFCDGEPAAADRASPKPRRKRTRRGEAEDTNHTADPEPSVTQEKCYLCHRAVPLKDYSRHTERCLERRVSRTATTGGLLSALDQSDRRDSEAGPSGSHIRPHEVIDLRDDDDEEDESLIRISNSPIRSFTAISEAEDCLIDFRKPHRAKKHVSKRR